jgi:hypothetical protein
LDRRPSVLVGYIQAPLVARVRHLLRGLFATLNGQGLEPDEELSRRPSEWNANYYPLLARTLVGLPDENKVPSLSDAGLTAKDVFEARQIRDAEREQPALCAETLDRLLESGEEPTRAAVNQAIVNRTSFTGNNQWFTPDEHIALARQVLGEIDLDPASHEIAQQTVEAFPELGSGPIKMPLDSKLSGEDIAQWPRGINASDFPRNRY